MTDAQFDNLDRFVDYADKQFELRLLAGCFASDRVEPLAGEAAHEQRQSELLLGVGDKAVQVVEQGVSHRQGLPAGAAARH